MIVRHSLRLSKGTELLFNVAETKCIFARRNHTHPIDNDMLQFPHIPRPGVCFQLLDQVLRHLMNVFMERLIVSLDKALHKSLDILGTFSEGRDGDGHNTQAVIDVLAQVAA